MAVPVMMAINAASSIYELGMYNIFLVLCVIVMFILWISGCVDFKCGHSGKVAILMGAVIIYTVVTTVAWSIIGI